MCLRRCFFLFQTASFLGPMAQLCHRYSNLAHTVWVDLFPQLWNLLTDKQQQVSLEYIPTLPLLSRTAFMHPISYFPSTAPPIPPFTLSPVLPLTHSSIHPHSSHPLSPHSPYRLFLFPWGYSPPPRVIHSTHPPSTYPLHSLHSPIRPIPHSLIQLIPPFTPSTHPQRALLTGKHCC